jgi:ABC-type transporter Mla subunit MlaD
MDENKNAFKVGVISGIMIILIAMLLIWKSGIFLRAAGYELIGEFPGINGLLKGAEVRYRGFKVGKVAKVFPGPKNIKVNFWIKSGVKVPDGSMLRVVFDGLIGEKYIDIRPNTDTKVMLKSGGVMQGYATSSLADFVDVGTQNLEHTKAILASLREVLTDGDVSLALKNMMLSLEKITDDVSHTVKSMNQYAQNQNFSEIIESLSSTAKSMNKIMDGIETNILNDKTANNINTLIENLTVFSTDLKTLLSAEDTGNKKSSGTASVVRSLANLEVKPAVGIEYFRIQKEAYYFADINFDFKKYFLKFGIGDRLGSSEFLNLQLGGRFKSLPLTTRLGLFYTKPGVGLDYQLLPELGISLEAYNLNKLELEFISRYSLHKDVDLLFGVRRNKEADMDNVYDNVSLGVSYKP